jgi:lysine 2,3-aminomutase
MGDPFRASRESFVAIRSVPQAEGGVASHRQLLDGDFWRAIPAYRDVAGDEFGDHRFQMKNTVTRPEQLLGVVRDLAPQSFCDDVADGLARAPMSVRVTPYVLSLIDWRDPYADPIRRQFIPVGSGLAPDHPMLRLDSLAEQDDSPVAGLVHRYRDRALLLALDTCPVYCRFCTRSYAVGTDTESVGKVSLKAKETRWDAALAYLRGRPEVEDVVVSGGDCYNLRPSQIAHIGDALLALPNILRIRFATKGPAVMPQKILHDEEWTAALTGVVERGRRVHKEVALHVHFNHPREITRTTKDAMDALFARGITVRNQAVLQRGVNDTVPVMRELTRRLAYCNVHPYYVYVHDLVRGVEDLRTSLQTALDLEKRVRGDSAGFNTPLFVCDAPSGGGKRVVHSFEHYDRETGVSVFTSPAVKSGYFLYFDPLDALGDDARARWSVAGERRAMIETALAEARAKSRAYASAGSVDTSDAEGPLHCAWTA